MSGRQNRERLTSMAGVGPSSPATLSHFWSHWYPVNVRCFFFPIGTSTAVNMVSHHDGHHKVVVVQVEPDGTVRPTVTTTRRRRTTVQLLWCLGGEGRVDWLQFHRHGKLCLCYMVGRLLWENPLSVRLLSSPFSFFVIAPAVTVSMKRCLP